MAGSEAERAFEIIQRLEEAGALGTGGRLPALLRYLVGEELAGRGDRIKAYAIATEVLGRNKTFDPAQDSIVRVEVARLRKALDLYFATAGRDAALKITIPKGGYRPAIGTDVATDDAVEGEATPAPASSPSRGGMAALAVLGLAALSVLAVLLGVVEWPFRGKPPAPQAYASATARLMLLPVEASQDAAPGLAAGLRAQLAAMLAQQSWLAVSMDERLPAPEAMPRKAFSLNTVLSRGEKGYGVQALLHQEPEHRVVWSGRYDSALLHQGALELARGIATDLAGDLGYTLGPVGQAVAGRSGETAPEVEDRFLCTMNAYRYWRGLEAKQRADALACLERLTTRLPHYAEGRALLALFALEDARQSVGAAHDAALARAEGFLRGANETDRLATTARMMVSACKDDVVATRAQAHALVAAAPNDADTLAEVANAAGPVALDWEGALRAEERAFALSSAPHPRYAHPRALERVMAGDYEGALAALSRVPQGNLATGQMMMLVLAKLAKAPQRAQGAAEALAAMQADRPEALRQRIEAACWHEDVKAAFRKALESALR